jgi:hypothetical protein
LSTRLITAIPAVRQTPGLVVKRVLHEQERNKLGIRRFIGENIDVSETSIHNRLFDSAIQQRMYSHCVRERPTSRITALGRAFFSGYDHPDAPPPEDDADPALHAARIAGADCRMLDDQLGRGDRGHPETVTSTSGTT